MPSPGRGTAGDARGRSPCRRKHRRGEKLSDVAAPAGVPMRREVASMSVRSRLPSTTRIPPWLGSTPTCPARVIDAWETRRRWRLKKPKPTASRVIARLLLSAPLSIGGAAEAGVQHVGASDYGALTCRDFVGTGQDNKAVIMWWLRGHHAGMTGTNSFDPKDAYAYRLGFYCGSHLAANLIETSERILTELDRGN
jgi:HdeA/HdeB family